MKTVARQQPIASRKGKERAAEIPEIAVPATAPAAVSTTTRVGSLRPRRTSATAQVPAKPTLKALGKRKAEAQPRAPAGGPDPLPSATDKGATKRRGRSSKAKVEPPTQASDVVVGVVVDDEVTPSSGSAAEAAPITMDESAPSTSTSTATLPTPASTSPPSASTSALPPTTATTPSPPSSPPPVASARALPTHPAHPHAITQPHIHSPLTPLAHTTTTPPGSPPALHTRVSPPLDAVDLGPLEALVLPPPVVGAQSGSAAATATTPTSSPKPSPKEIGKDERERSASRSAHGSPVPSPPPILPALSGPAALLFDSAPSTSPSPIALPTLLPTPSFLGAFGEQGPFAESSVGQSAESQPALGMPAPVGALGMLGVEMGLSMPLPFGLGMGESPAGELGLGLQMGMGMDIAGSAMVGGGSGVSESELGFGFPAQEGFGAAYGAAPPQEVYGMDMAPSLPPQQQGQQQQEQHPDEQMQMDQQQQGMEQARGGSPTPSLRLTMKQQRKLTYTPPIRLEDAPMIQKDTGLWATACKLRVWEISRRYTPDILRSIVAEQAHDYFTAVGRFPIGYKRARRRSGLARVSAPTPTTSPTSADGEDEFMTEKTYAFELDDDDNDDEEGGASLRAMYGDEDEEMDEYDEEWDDEDEEDETEEEDDVAPPVAVGPSTADARALPLAGDEEDAEGEMEADLEAFTDPSFNAELSVPAAGATPPLRGAAPLPPPAPPLPLKEQTNFYVPIDSAAPQYWDTPPALAQGGAYGDGVQEGQAGGQQHEQQHEEHQHQQHQPPVEIQLTPAPAHAYYFPPPILPLPPPRLDSIRVGYLRQAELGAKLTGRGTPADRMRAAQWARGYAAWCAAQQAAAKAAPRNERAESAESRSRSRSPPRDAGDREDDVPMRLTLDGGETEQAQDARGGDSVQWETFLRMPFDEPASSGADPAQDEQRHQQQHHEIVSTAVPSGSRAYSTPREPGAADGAGDASAGVGSEGLYQMGMFGYAAMLGPHPWLDPSAVVPAAQGVIVGEQEGHGGAAAGTSTLSFALG
ncbi:hypothetical protein HYPSUDRAFT_784530 [Hypholoma sublateritium FD-334 SS-4]|uniref:Uncharacterized protein n=1 Tax=Hypholoma sublateritium (strain FD-334 SS-4) TaxID=945553 RepID=A0A0D2NVF8_HYPSF|nr:hypothetical protein HYPSUDRAFT_784530 [Hypholoma sublateritium FD-334 SS-4]